MQRACSKEFSPRRLVKRRRLASLLPSSAIHEVSIEHLPTRFGTVRGAKLWESDARERPQTVRDPSVLSSMRRRLGNLRPARRSVHESFYLATTDLTRLRGDIFVRRATSPAGLENSASLDLVMLLPGRGPAVHLPDAMVQCRNRLEVSTVFKSPQANDSLTHRWEIPLDGLARTRKE
jgi:hypothetical protein